MLVQNATRLIIENCISSTSNVGTWESERERYSIKVYNKPVEDVKPAA